MADCAAFVSLPLVALSSKLVLGEDLLAAAKVRELCTFIDLHLELAARELYPQAFFGGTVDEATKVRARKVLGKNIKGFQRLARFAPYVAGETFTVADCAAFVSLPLAALAARVLYNDLLASGVRIFEYTPAFLHAKVAVVDDDWATVGSSNIDPLSLLLNLEANAVVVDESFAQLLRQRLDAAFAEAREIQAPPLREGWRRRLSHGFVSWCASLYLRVAGITGRY